MKVKVLTKTFVEPQTHLPGSVIDYIGPWGPQFEALDDEAKAAEEAYRSSRGPTDAEGNPVEGLDMTLRPRSSVIANSSETGGEGQEEVHVGLAANTGTPEELNALLADKLANDPNFAAALLASVARIQAPAGGAIVQADGPGKGTEAPTVSPEEAAAEAEKRAKAQPAPVEGEAQTLDGTHEEKDKADKANAASAKSAAKSAGISLDDGPAKK